MAGLRSRFNKGDMIRVTDDKSGNVVATGTALQSRDHTGWADFQVLEGVSADWVRISEWNLNFVTVEVV